MECGLKSCVQQGRVEEIYGIGSKGPRSIILKKKKKTSHSQSETEIENYCNIAIKIPSPLTLRPTIQF